MTPAEWKTTLLTALASVLVPAGFRRRGATFARRSDDLVHLVQLQSSQKSTAELAIVTVNLGVFSTALEKALGGPITAPTEADCHWRQRLGFLTPVSRDVWWQVDDAPSAVRVGAEIAQALSAHGLPALDELRSSAALIRLWQTGASPGLTDRQRRDYLGVLVRAAGSHSDHVA